MSALPKIPQITVRPLRRPTYNNRNLSSFALWFGENALALQDWYDQLRACDPEDFCDFTEFCCGQFDREVQERDQRMLDRQDEPRLRSWDEIDADNAGVPMRGPI